jgi:large subunit ribosomal protein L22
MPTWGYSVTKLDPERSAIASGRDMPISFKDAVEICKSIKGLDIESAKKFLEDVIAMKRMVPIKRL